MPYRDPSLTLGIEEEYLLVDRETRNVAADPPRDIWERCEALCPDDLVEPEMLRAQLEIGTRVCANVSEARESLTHLRRSVCDVSADYGLAPIAASTHPFGRWQDQQHTEKERYIALTRDMALVARRLMICGMHVHVGVEDDELRVDLMNQFVHFLPLLLSLSCSSPFWEGDDTGMMSYRLTVFDGFPRTGLPDRFASYHGYNQFVDTLIGAGIMEDATRIWWDMRISARYPTIEIRVMDVCTRVQDAISLAALVQCILSMLARLRHRDMRWRIYPRDLVLENRWRAMRYGPDEGLINLRQARIVRTWAVLEELLDLVNEDAERLGCKAELDRLPLLLDRGTSAHRQRAVYSEAIEQGASKQEALSAVVDWLIDASHPDSKEAQ